MVVNLEHMRDSLLFILMSISSSVAFAFFIRGSKVQVINKEVASCFFLLSKHVLETLQVLELTRIEH